MQQPPDPQHIISLFHTALYDQGGEMVEGGFVDYWVSNASVALDDLEARFRTQEIPTAALDWVRVEIRKGNASPDSVTRLLRSLGRSFSPVREMVSDMLQDPTPQARVAAVIAGSELLGSSLIAALYTDESPLVRAAVVGSLKEAQPLFLRALDDPDPSVRIAAVRRVRFKDDVAGGEALAAHYWAESNVNVRAALLTRVAESAHSVATSNALPGRPSMRERIGEPLITVLLDGLTHNDSKVRIQVADGVRYLNGADVAHALLEQLRVESDPDVRSALVRYPNRNFSALPDEAVPLFASLLVNDSDISLRITIADQMMSLGPTAAPPLITALDDPSSDIQEAAARALQGAGSLRHLPDLLHHLVLATYPPLYNALNQAIEMIIHRAHMHPPASVPDRSAVVQSLINALNPDPVTQWHILYCKETLNALPLYGTRSLYLWALRPDGEVLVIDMDSANMHTEIETDALARFAAVLYGSYRYPELRDLIPVPPLHTNPLHYLPRSEDPPQE